VRCASGRFFELQHYVMTTLDEDMATEEDVKALVGTK
jgi:hypothetical protein